VIEDAVNQSRPLAELKEIAVTFDASADARVPIDCHDAFLLCSNILLNSLQHSPQAATVRIMLDLTEGTARFRTQDQGEGISEEELAHIFEPFYRGDPSRSRKTGGTGLGLSICKAICERAGGSIEIANHPGGGALVTVILPADRVVANSAPSVSITV
jgi:signal transduction histidine kinase